LLRLAWGHVYAQGRDQLLSDLWLSSSDAGLPSGVLINADVLKTAKRHRPLTRLSGQLRLSQETGLVPLCV